MLVIEVIFCVKYFIRILKVLHPLISVMSFFLFDLNKGTAVFPKRCRNKIYHAYIRRNFVDNYLHG